MPKSKEKTLRPLGDSPQMKKSPMNLPIGYGKLLRDLSERKLPSLKEEAQSQKGGLPPLSLSRPGPHARSFANLNLRTATEPDNERLFWMNEETKSIFQVPKINEKQERRAPEHSNPQSTR